MHQTAADSSSDHSWMQVLHTPPQQNYLSNYEYAGLGPTAVFPGITPAPHVLLFRAFTPREQNINKVHPYVAKQATHIGNFET